MNYTGFWEYDRLYAVTLTYLSGLSYDSACLNIVYCSVVVIPLDVYVVDAHDDLMSSMVEFVNEYIQQTPFIAVNSLETGTTPNLYTLCFKNVPTF